MYHQGKVDPDAVREGAAKLDALERTAAELEAAVRGDTGPQPDAPREPAGAPRRRPARRQPVMRPMIGAEDRPTSPPAGASAEPRANGERDDRMKEAVETARRQAEDRATAEILALEEDLERERARAAKSLAEVQRRLEEAEARAAGSVNVTDTRSREDDADWLGEQRG